MNGDLALSLDTAGDFSIYLNRSGSATANAVAPTAVDLAQQLAPPPAVSKSKEDDLPTPGRLMVGKLLHLVIERPGLAEPFGAAALAAETNRRFEDRLRAPIDTRTASAVLRRMLDEGWLQIAQEGKPFHEALYVRKCARPG